ncbi:MULTISPECIES: MetQ/NlpA family ABC transporter substrate-binding protein [unclassified Exiguobacterium]|uniref:MetQ/NlpA family ABC transporter substrate-binding protein n=1 Tax=unclassified Exiguobacterium TaxID=2644629 RepID=UPI001039E710|nr:MULTISPECIES: MetQ/NlpA family ABC transporter substrate-binding protein [unclassified Exiguobacterium]TCI69688.1 ABC transporter substrate-binding protein [Exiguobacterium sp. IPCI3]TCI78986.1 ABC transporter substrate-binding protein [Exiguobacterium sp. IPCH1]TCI81573.1 ABC transporter substrate-binding protein [Exiguobacterium sp. IPBC4]
MKKLLALFASLTLVLAACGNDSETNTTEAPSNEPQTLKVASLIPPMTDMLEIAKEQLAEDNIELEIVVLGDNVQPNTALAAKEVDANFFQHVPYMEEFNRSNDANLVPIEPIYFANYGVYSKEYDNMNDIPEGATIAIANDVSNIDRSLSLLAQHDVIELGEKNGSYYTQADITENPKNLKFEEVDLLMLARAYDDVDAVLMTPAYAAPLGLTPKSDALLTEGVENDFAITLVAREDNKDEEAIQKLGEALTSDEVRAFLEENYEETAIPAF